MLTVWDRGSRRRRRRGFPMSRQFPGVHHLPVCRGFRPVPALPCLRAAPSRQVVRRLPVCRALPCLLPDRAHQDVRGRPSRRDPADRAGRGGQRRPVDPRLPSGREGRVGPVRRRSLAVRADRWGRAGPLSRRVPPGREGPSGTARSRGFSGGRRWARRFRGCPRRRGRAYQGARVRRVIRRVREDRAGSGAWSARTGTMREGHACSCGWHASDGRWTRRATLCKENGLVPGIGLATIAMLWVAVRFGILLNFTELFDTVPYDTIPWECTELQATLPLARVTK